MFATTGSVLAKGQPTLSGEIYGWWIIYAEPVMTPIALALVIAGCMYLIAQFVGVKRRG